MRADCACRRFAEFALSRPPASEFESPGRPTSGRRGPELCNTYGLRKELIALLRRRDVHGWYFTTPHEFTLWLADALETGEKGGQANGGL